MKVCDVVLNSVWFDPRVKRQISEYVNNGIELSCVGYKDRHYDETKMRTIPCKCDIVSIDKPYPDHQREIFRKLWRKYLIFRQIRDAIIKQKPEAIHANDLNALIAAYAAKRRLKCKLIYDAHEVNTGSIASIGKSRIWCTVRKLIERHIVKRVDLMVCVSNAAADYFERLYHIPRPMVITNCALKSEQHISSKKHPYFEVLNHGQFYEGRGYDIMTEACPLLKDYPEIHLVIRGFGKLENELRATVAAKAEEGQFIFYPKVNVEELIPLAAKSHIGVAVTEPICLNFKLSVSNKLFEYAAAGLPVIMSDIPEHRYLNDKYKFGIVIEKNTPECFANAVLKLYRDKAFYEMCRKNAVKMTEALNWENEFKKLIDMEKKL